MPTVGFKREKSLKDLLIRANVPREKQQVLNFVFIRENTAKFALFRRTEHFY